jgi:hypothetical protein
VAAESFTRDGPPDIRRITLGAIDVAQELNILRGSNKLTLYFENNTGKFAWVGTDGQAINANYFSVPPNQPMEINVGTATKIYLASATASTAVSVLVEKATA